jgi:hypothetical protein
MGEAVKMKAPAHYLRVDLDDPGEAEYWLVVLDAPRHELEAAIAAVGRDALEVKAWLQVRRGPGSSPLLPGEGARRACPGLDPGAGEGSGAGRG